MALYTPVTHDPSEVLALTVGTSLKTIVSGSEFLGPLLILALYKIEQQGFLEHLYYLFFVLEITNIQ